MLRSFLVALLSRGTQTTSCLGYPERIAMPPIDGPAGYRDEGGRVNCAWVALLAACAAPGQDLGQAGAGRRADRAWARRRFWRRRPAWRRRPLLRPVPRLLRARALQRQGRRPLAGAGGGQDVGGAGLGLDGRSGAFGFARAGSGQNIGGRFLRARGGWRRLGGRGGLVSRRLSPAGLAARRLWRAP